MTTGRQSVRTLTATLTHVDTEKPKALEPVEREGGRGGREEGGRERGGRERGGRERGRERGREGGKEREGRVQWGRVGLGLRKG